MSILFVKKLVKLVVNNIINIFKNNEILWKKIKKLYLQQKKRALKKVVGTTKKPRLAVFRSHKHIYAQIIDDTQGKTLVASSTLKKGLINTDTSTASIEASKIIGQTIGKIALEKNITKVIFDRGKRIYHGRIAGVANGAREAGLLFKKLKK